MKTKPYRSTFNTHSAKSMVALVIVALLTFSDLAIFARSECDPSTLRRNRTRRHQHSRLPRRHRKRRTRQRFRMINWTRWWRQLRFIRIRC